MRGLNPRQQHIGKSWNDAKGTAPKLHAGTIKKTFHFVDLIISASRVTLAFLLYLLFAALKVFKTS